MELSQQELRILNSILLSMPTSNEFRISDLVFERYSNNMSFNSDSVPAIEYLSKISLNLHKQLLRDNYIRFVSQSMPNKDNRKINTPNVILTEDGILLAGSSSYETYIGTVNAKLSAIDRAQRQQTDWIKIFTAISTIVAVAAIIISALDYNRNLHKDKLELQQHQEDSTIQALQILIDKGNLSGYRDTVSVRILPTEKKNR